MDKKKEKEKEIEVFEIESLTLLMLNQNVPVRTKLLVGVFSLKKEARLLHWVVFSADNLTLNGPLFGKVDHSE